MTTPSVIQQLVLAVAPHEERAWAGNFGSPPSTEDDILRPALEALGLDPDMPFIEFRERWGAATSLATTDIQTLTRWLRYGKRAEVLEHFEFTDTGVARGHAFCLAYIKGEE